MQNIKETKEAVFNAPKLIDVLSGDYKFHYVSLRKLPKILKQGIFSTGFGQRIKDPQFAYLNENFSVWVINDPKEIFMALPAFDRIVGLIIKASKPTVRKKEGLINEIPIRIAPRKFLGLIIVDTLSVEEEHLYRRVGDVLMGDSEIQNILENVRRIKQMAETENINIPRLPIYGTSGNLYSPQRLNYKALLDKIK